MSDAISNDRRITRTKLAIRTALVALIEEKGFDVLTVKDITTLANINRGTFYLHYQDKFDLLKQIEVEISGILRKYFSGQIHYIWLISTVPITLYRWW